MEVRLRTLAELNRGELPRVRFEDVTVRVALSDDPGCGDIMEIEFEDHHTARAWAFKILREVERRYPTPPLPASAVVDDEHPPQQITVKQEVPGV